MAKADYEKFMTEYERGLLSLSFRNLDILIELRQSILADYFLFPAHKVIFTALCSLAAQPSINKIDLEALCVECDKLGLQALGVNPDYLMILSQGGYDKSNFDFYLEKVKNAYLKFTLYKKLQDAAKSVENNCNDTEKTLTGESLIENISSDLSQLQSFHGSADSSVLVADRVEQFVLERASNPKEVMGLKTGFPTLDNCINGLMPGTLTIIAGIAKAGKSTVLTNIVDYVTNESEDQVPVLVISTEMLTDEDISRSLAIRTLIEERKIINGLAYNDPKLKPILDKAISQIKKSKFYHIYLPDFNAAKICSIIYHHKIKYNIGLAIFDYIKMSTTGEDHKDKREDQVLGDITTALKNTAGMLNIPIVTACQVNSRTGLIADSDRIQRYANTLIEFRPKSMEELEEQEFFKHGTHWLHIFKTRAGGNKKIPIRFWKKCLKLQEAEVFESEEDGDVAANEDLLTTPTDWQTMVNESFKIEKVNEIVNQVDSNDLKIVGLNSNSTDDELF